MTELGSCVSIRRAFQGLEERLHLEEQAGEEMTEQIRFPTSKLIISILYRFFIPFHLFDPMPQRIPRQSRNPARRNASAGPSAPSKDAGARTARQRLLSRLLSTLLLV